jgi:hypothetical protein
MAIFAVPLYLNQKTSRLKKLKNGICPSCDAAPTSFYDETRHVSFNVSPIKSEVLKTNCCGGDIEIKYTCNKCGLAEVHNA